MSSPRTLTASDAFEQSVWYLRYALDRLDSDPKCTHPAVRAHGAAALAQTVAVVKALKLS